MSKHNVQYNGLSSGQAAELLAKNGQNVTQNRKKSNFFVKFVKQFGDLMIIILLVASALSFGMAIYSGNKADLLEPLIIVAIVFANALLGTVQEYRAEKSLDALTKLTAPKTQVMRDGKIVVVDSAQLVVGDLCFFAAGDVVTADCQLLQGEISVNQSALTGESIPVDKCVTPPNKMVADENIAYGGSLVTKGRCSGVVVATGKHTELGKIAKMLADSQQSLTPLQQKLKQLSKVIAIVCIAVCMAVLVIGFAKGVGSMQQGDTLTSVFLNVFLTSVSLAAAAIPEGLPAVVTVVLAKGIQKMASKNAIVRRLTAVEALGSATVICTDKTGTLTQNKMTLMGVFTQQFGYVSNNNLNAVQPLLQQFCWCCDCAKDANGNWLGDPTEIAVANALISTQQATRLWELPFDSARKMMTVVVRVGDKLFAVTKGSLDGMRHAKHYALFQKQQHVYAKKGHRVLALSVVEVQSNFAKNAQIEQNLCIKALFVIADPPRPEARQAVATCKSAGIRPVMITGDSLPTATEIAANLGMLTPADKAIDGATLAAMDDATLAKQVHTIAVYARATPADKLRIVSAWQKRGDVVAMTGDGVNDAPALNSADIGCAMGSGTEVAKTAADMVLADDNFATVVDAVSLGRSVYLNIKKAVTYLLSCNVGEVLSVFFALLIFDVTPLSAMQLLWINLVTDGLPGLALGIYKQEKDVMNRPPLGKKETFFSGGNGKRIAFVGVFFAIATLVGYALGNLRSYQAACTMAYLVLSLSQLLYALQMRQKGGIFSRGITKFMAASTAISVAFVAVVAFVPVFACAFGLCLLPWWLYVVAVALSFVPTFANWLWQGVCAVVRCCKSKTKPLLAAKR